MKIHFLAPNKNRKLSYFQIFGITSEFQNFSYSASIYSVTLEPKKKKKKGLGWFLVCGGVVEYWYLMAP